MRLALPWLLACATVPDPPPFDAYRDRDVRCDAGEVDACLSLGNELLRSWDEANIRRSFTTYDRACRLGDARACPIVADGWLTGHLGAPRKDPLLAVEHLDRSCELGMGDSCFELWLLLEHGNQGVAQDRERARALAERACGRRYRGQNIEQMCWRAIHDHAKGVPQDPARAESLMRELLCAEDGPSCDAVIAARFLGGYDFPDRFDRSRALYDRACAAKVPGACAQKAAMLAEGVGVKKDVRAGIAIYLALCDEGDASACFAAGRLYSEELRDVRKADEAFDRACAGDRECRLRAARSFAAAKHYARAEKTFRAACEENDRFECVEWASVLVATKRYDKAAQILGPECEKNNARACTSLGALHATGRGVKKNAARAEELIEKACKLGDASACPLIDNIAALVKGIGGGIAGGILDAGAFLGAIFIVWPLETLLFGLKDLVQ